MELQDEDITRRYERIQYAGVVHVRGMFRRVWRPRQLEIDDGGILRYYASNAKERLDRALQLFSLPDFTDIEFKPQSDEELWDHMSMSDGGDLNDSEMLTRNTRSESNQHQSMEIFYHNIHRHRPKATMIVISARLIDFSSLRDIHIGLPPGTFGFVFSGKSISDQQRGSTPSFDQNLSSEVDGLHMLGTGDVDHFCVSRDYICYVETLEEAEHWVDVLKAASSTSYTQRFPISKPQKPHSNQKHSVEQCMIADDDSVDDTIVGADSDQLRMPENSSKHDTSMKKNFYTIVSAVTGYKLGIKRWSRLFGIESEIYFEIRLLLLRPDQLKIRGRKRIDGDAIDWDIQEIFLYRSFFEVQTLVYHLKQRHYNTSVLEACVKGVEASMEPSFMTIYDYRTYLKMHIDAVDRVMREITSDVSMCNSVETKKFFSLNHNDVDPRTAEHRLSPPNIGKHLIPKINVKTIAPEESLDHFVSSWLLSPKLQDSWTRHFFTYMILLLKDVKTEIVCSFTFFYLLSKFLFACSTLMGFGFHIRLDIFLFTTLLAYFMGYSHGKSSNGTTALSMKPLLSKENDISPGSLRLRETERLEMEEDGIGDDTLAMSDHLSSPLPMYPASHSCWSQPNDKIFRVRSASYLEDRIKCPSGPSPFKCRGVDMWLTETPERNIARLPCILGGKLKEEETLIVNFLLPFGNFVAYFTVNRKVMAKNVKTVWDKFIKGDQQYRDARFKLLPVVVEGPWIVKRAVGPGTAPALLGESIPLQYFFSQGADNKKAVYEIDVIITASRIAKGILSIVKGHTKHLTIALGFIIEATKDEELPETVIASCQIHSLHLEHCMDLPTY